MHMSRLVYEFVTAAQDQNQSNGIDTASPSLLLPLPNPNNNSEIQHSSPTRLLSGMCCKHFAAYDIEGNRVGFPAKVDARNLWESYLPAFQACVQEAQATHIMCSYNKINGVPTCGEDGLLNNVAREQWGFKGFVVSDYDAWKNMYNINFTETIEEAAIVGINAGLDQEGGGTSVINTLAGAVQDNKVNTSTVAKSFRRLMRIRLKLGMFDPPTTVKANYIQNTTAQSPAHMSTARLAAQQSICLYKNNEKVLPLLPEPAGAGTASAARNAEKTILIVGTQATSSGLLMGNYAESAAQGNWGTSILDEFKNRESSTGYRITYSPGCNSVTCSTTDGFKSAVDAAITADVVIVCLGLHFNNFCKDGHNQKQDPACEKEGLDRTQIELPGNQSQLVHALRQATSKPIIILLIHGGSIALGKAAGEADAVLDAWYPGIQGASAIADVVFGLYNPGGRTAVTWYTKSTDLPPSIATSMDFYNGNGLTYRYYNGSVLYPYGYGLSYTTFSYSNMSVSKTEIDPCETFHVTVTVTNTGNRDGDEVVQLYAKQPYASVKVPRVRLVAFERIVAIKSGQSVTISLEVRPDSHTAVLDGEKQTDIYNHRMNGNVVVQKGILSLFVGGGQPDYYHGHQTSKVMVKNSAAINSCT